MRPRGQIRQALGDAAPRLAQQHPAGITWRQLAEAACVGYQAARRTVCEMRRAGELEPTGDVVRLPHSRRPLALYVPTAGTDTAAHGHHHSSSSTAAGALRLATGLKAWVTPG